MRVRVTMSSSRVAARVWATDMTRAHHAEMDMVHFCPRPVSASDCRICFGFMHLIDRVLKTRVQYPGTKANGPGENANNVAKHTLKNAFHSLI